MSQPTHALVLAAGLGTRLAPLTSVRAKPAIPVAGEPLARRIVRWLADQNIRQVTLNLHHRPETITRVLGDGADLGATVRYSWEQPSILGSAGGPRFALDIVGADTFLLVNGDTLTDVPLGDLWRAHRASGALITMALTPHVNPLRYGGVKLDAHGSVTGFVSKGPAAADSLHFVGVQVVSREAFLGLAYGRPANTVGGLYDKLLAERPGSIRAHPVHGNFWDVGTVEDYWRTSAALSPTEPAHHAPSGGFSLRRTILWDRVSIGKGASLDECIVTDDAVIPAGATYRRQILMRDAGGELLAVPFEVN